MEEEPPSNNGYPDVSSRFLEPKEFRVCYATRQIRNGSRILFENGEEARILKEDARGIYVQKKGTTRIFSFPRSWVRE